MPRDDDKANPNALALRWALACQIKPLKRAAWLHIDAALKAEQGHLQRVADRIGVSLSTVRRYLAQDKELNAARMQYAELRDVMPGRPPGT